VENYPMTVPASDKTPEQIQDEMLHTRESLTEKVTALENQVVGTVQTAADTLTGTVESMKSFITTAPGAVSDTVKQAASVVSEKVREAFDISGHVREYPWTSVGVSTLLGCVTGWLVFRDGSSTSASEPSPARSSPPMAPVYSAPPSSARSGPGIFDEFFTMIGRKVREIAENVIDTASGAVNRSVREGLPKLVDAAAERLTPSSESPERRFAGDFHG